MADIFISYANEDRAIVGKLARALEDAGYSTWWDTKILGGRPYRKAIIEEITDAPYFIVVWSKRSVESDFVVDEVDTARKQRKPLVPVSFDGSEGAIGYMGYQVIDLAPWYRTGDEENLRRLTDTLNASVARKQVQERNSVKKATSLQFPRVRKESEKEHLTRVESKNESAAGKPKAAPRRKTESGETRERDIKKERAAVPAPDASRRKCSADGATSVPGKLAAERRPRRISIAKVLLVAVGISLAAYFYLSYYGSNLPKIEAALSHRSGSLNKVAAYSPDGKQLATISEGGIGRVWDATSGKLTILLDGHKNLNDIDWSPSGNRLATASEDGSGRVWDATSGQPTAFLMGHEKAIRLITWSPSGKRLATVSDDRTGRIWDATSGKQVALLSKRAPTDLFYTSVAWSPDGKRLATGSFGTAQVWDAASGQLTAFLRVGNFPVDSIDWSPTSEHLATAERFGHARVWHADTGKEPFDLMGGTRMTVVVDIAWSPVGNRLATAHASGRGLVWNAASGKMITFLMGHENRIYDIVWSPDGRHLATASLDKTGRIWDATSGEPLAILTGAGLLRSLAWSPDGERLAATTDARNGAWHIFQLSNR